MKKVYSFQDIPNGYVDASIFGMQRFALCDHAHKGDLPGVHFFTHKTNKKGKVYVDRLQAERLVGKLREKAEARKEEKKPVVTHDHLNGKPKVPNAIEIMKSLRSLHKKVDRLLAEWEGK